MGLGHIYTPFLSGTPTLCPRVSLNLNFCNNSPSVGVCGNPTWGAQEALCVCGGEGDLLEVNPGIPQGQNTPEIVCLWGPEHGADR